MDGVFNNASQGADEESFEGDLHGASERCVQQLVFIRDDDGSIGRMEQSLMVSLWGVWKNTKVKSGAAALGVLGNSPVVKCQEGSVSGGGAWQEDRLESSNGSRSIHGKWYQSCIS